MTVLPHLNDRPLSKHTIPLILFARRRQTRRAEEMRGKRLIKSMAQPSKSDDPQNKSHPPAQTPASHLIPRSSIQRKSRASESVESLQEEGYVRRLMKIFIPRLLTSKRSIVKFTRPSTQQTDLVVAISFSERGSMFWRGLEFLLPEIVLDPRLRKISIQGARTGNDRIDCSATKRFPLSHGLQRMGENPTRSGLEKSQ
jgi:hypothetical protein